MKQCVAGNWLVAWRELSYPLVFVTL